MVPSSQPHNIPKPSISSFLTFAVEYDRKALAVLVVLKRQNQAHSRISNLHASIQSFPYRSVTDLITCPQGRAIRWNVPILASKSIKVAEDKPLKIARAAKLKPTAVLEHEPEPEPEETVVYPIGGITRVLASKETHLCAPF